jgi:hypothetical protein
LPFSLGFARQQCQESLDARPRQQQALQPGHVPDEAAEAGRGQSGATGGDAAARQAAAANDVDDNDNDNDNAANDVDNDNDNNDNGNDDIVGAARSSRLRFPHEVVHARPDAPQGARRHGIQQQVKPIIIIIEPIIIIIEPIIIIIIVVAIAAIVVAVAVVVAIVVGIRTARMRSYDGDGDMDAVAIAAHVAIVAIVGIVGIAPASFGQLAS